MLMDREMRKEQIREWAEELGFARTGFAPALRPEAAHAHLLEWLARGYQAGMTWMARAPDARSTPEQILEGCRTVIAVALPYWKPEPVPAAPDLPRIARYARGEDYHEVVGEKLHALRDRLAERVPEARFRIAVDTSPVLEKAFAEQAGLGWIAKNTCLIHPELGSWFFLGLIFTTIELEPDAPITDLCGTCTRCLDVCPSGALPEPFVLDARRCLSYWNIEHRGPHDPEWSPLLGDWLVGCDLCQEVCPWNRKAPPSVEPRFEPRTELTERTAAEWAELEDGAYRDLVRGTAITRIKPADMRRNARAILENQSRDTGGTIE